MPALVACNRRWRIGSDDLACPALSELVLRAIWLVVALAVFFSHQPEEHCDASGKLRIYLIGLLVGCSLIILLNASIVWVSLQGTIIQDRPRKHMPRLLYLHLLLTIIEVGWTILGTVWAFNSDITQCYHANVNVLVQVTVILNWVLLAVIIVGIFVVFDPLGTPRYWGHVPDAAESSEVHALRLKLSPSGRKRARQLWKTRLKLFCCCACLDPNSSFTYRDVADTFAGYFEDINLVTSDVIAGFVLLYKNQTAENVCHPEPLTAGNSAGNCTGPVPEWMTAEAAHHYIRYAIGCYGWPLFVISHPPADVCSLVCQRTSFCACCRPWPDYVVDDNCCLCNTVALKMTTHLCDEDLLYVSHHDRIFEVPFYIAVDHDTSSVVVAIRGTLSVNDTLTDLSAGNESVSIEGCPEDSRCHCGMWRAATFVKKKLDEIKVLDRAFSLYPSYTLVVTGHSLGAGTAAVLSILLRPSYPGLRCLAFSPPGGLLSLQLAKYTEEFVFSVVLGQDIIPRLSLPAMEDLKLRLVDCIVRCDKPKHAVIMGGCWSVLFGRTSAANETFSAEPTTRPLLSPLSKTCSTLHNDRNQANLAGGDDSSFTEDLRIVQFHSRLFPPGRILHITYSSEGYRSHWVSPPFFDGVIVSSRMFLDHMAPAVQDALAHIINDSCTGVVVEEPIS